MLVAIRPKNLKGKYEHLEPEIRDQFFPAVTLTEQKGVGLFKMWNPDWFIDNQILNEYPEFYVAEPSEGSYTAYGVGVCDHYRQVLERYKLEEDARNFIVALVQIRRKDEPPHGGWRFHKWGPYIGTHEITHEYLYDQTDMDEVFTFHIYEVLA